MKEIFGIPTTSIMFVLLAIFVACMLAAIWIAFRNRVVFKMGIRNVPRRPAQTILIIVGLMLSTLIIAAAFTTGDTLNASIKGEVLNAIRYTDERVVPGTGDTDTVSGPVMPESLADDLEQQLTGNPDIEGVLAYLSESVPVINERTRLSEPALNLTGLDVPRLEPFGGVNDIDGNPIDVGAMPEDSVILGEKPAEELDAVPGDVLVIYTQNQPHQVTVFAIGEDSMLTGITQPGSEGGMAMPLERAQELLGYDGRISSVEVTNPGGIESGIPHTDGAMAALDSALEGTPYSAFPAKRDYVQLAEEAGNIFMTLFVVFGLFSIAVGVLLIFLIFVMLAAERKSEMGMARAVGMKRRHLMQMFLAEGVAYDLVAALIGAGLGVGVAFIMASYMANFVGDYFTLSPTASWQGLVIAYTLGVVVTFLTILISSWRVSKLNIVEAIRDVPEPVLPRASRRWLVYGVIGAVLSVFLIWSGAQSHSDFQFSTGVSLLPFSIAIILRRFGVSARLVYSVASVIVLLYWLVPDSLKSGLLPDLEGDIEMFFVSGIVLVASATMLIVWNAEAFTSVVRMLGGSFRRWLPAVRTAIAYPLERKGRTGLTIAMFSLVIFSLVTMASIQATANNVVFGSEYRSGGWDIQATQAPINRIDEISGAYSIWGGDQKAIESNALLETVDPSRAQIRIAGTEEWKDYTVNGAHGAFLEQSTLPLQTRAVGYETDEAVFEALRQSPNVAVVDNNAVPGTTFGMGGDLFYLEGVSSSDETMDPIEVEMGDPITGQVRTITVIGIMDAKVSTFPGFLMSMQTYNSVFSDPATTSYLTHVVKAAPGVDVEQLSTDIESRLLTFGVQTRTYEDVIEEAAGFSTGFLRLVEGFMMLGLVVGVAALGVLAFRSVVERRQQIGMLRAIGYQRIMVAASFLIESSMITILGTLSGTILGILLARNVVTSEYFFGSGEGISLIVPWGEIGVFILIAVAASLLMAWIPARRAARVPIAEALRYE